MSDPPVLSLAKGPVALNVFRFLQLAICYLDQGRHISLPLQAPSTLLHIGCECCLKSAPLLRPSVRQSASPASRSFLGSTCRPPAHPEHAEPQPGPLPLPRAVFRPSRSLGRAWASPQVLNPSMLGSPDCDSAWHNGRWCKPCARSLRNFRSESVFCT